MGDKMDTTIEERGPGWTSKIKSMWSNKFPKKGDKKNGELD